MNFLSSFLSFFLSFFLVCNCCCLCRGSSSPRSLARSFPRALPFFLLPFVFGFFGCEYTVLKFRVVCCASVDALVRFLGFSCRFPAPLSTQPALRTQLWFLYFIKTEFHWVSPLFSLSLSLLFAPCCSLSCPFSCSCCKRK